MLGGLKIILPGLLYLAGIIIALLSGMGKVRWGLLFLIPLLPLQNVLDKLVQFPLGKDFNDILFIALIVGWLISSAQEKKPLLEKTPFNTIVFLYVLFTYFSLWQGSTYLGYPPPLSAADARVHNWKNYILLLLLFLIVLNNVRSVREMKRLFVFMCCTIFLMNLYTGRQIASMTSWMSRTKIEGTFVWLGANEVAAFYATYTFVLLGLFFFVKEKRLKLFLGYLVYVCFFCVLFLFSRGAYLAAIVAFLFIALVRQRKLLIPVFFLIIFWQAIVPQDVLDRLTYSEVQGELDRSAADRLVLWQKSLEYFGENPITGVGFNVFQHLGFKRDAHNIYMRTLAEQGIVGLSFLLVIMGLALRRGWILYRRAGDVFLKGLGFGFCACVMAVMVGNFFGDRWSYLPLGAYFWVFLGMVERGNVLAEQERAVAHTKGKKRFILKKKASNGKENKYFNFG